MKFRNRTFSHQLESGRWNHCMHSTKNDSRAAVIAVFYRFGSLVRKSSDISLWNLGLWNLGLLMMMISRSIWHEGSINAASVARLKHKICSRDLLGFQETCTKMFKISKNQQIFLEPDTLPDCTSSSRTAVGGDHVVVGVASCDLSFN